MVHRQAPQTTETELITAVGVQKRLLYVGTGDVVQQLDFLVRELATRVPTSGNRVVVTRWRMRLCVFHQVRQQKNTMVVVISLGIVLVAVSLVPIKLAKFTMNLKDIKGNTKRQ